MDLPVALPLLVGGLEPAARDNPRVREVDVDPSVALFGRVEVDGVTTIKIVNVTRKAEPRFTMYFWVNPKTYLPVRTLFDNQRTFPAVDRVHEQTDYMWLRPTRANLANLTVRIPAGFKRTASPTLIGACGFAPCN